MSIEILTHAFHGQSVRIIPNDHGEPWVVLADLIQVLGLSSKPSQVAAQLADDTKEVPQMDTPGGRQPLSVVNESGIWTVILGSDAPNAEPIRRWVASDVLTPPASAWNDLIEATGDHALRDAAQVLSRDPFINIDQNKLSTLLRDIGWIDSRHLPYQRYVDQGLLASRPRPYEGKRTGERIEATPQVRITLRGLGKLHHLLGGTEPLAVDMQEVAA